MNKENLQKMADYIRTVPKDGFDIGYFRSGDETKPECDSVGCVIGHCTVLDADNIENNFVRLDGIIKFGDWSEHFTGLKCSSDSWRWCFLSRWRIADNTPEGAALRIEWLIKNGLPENWEDQMIGSAELCYK